MRRSIRLSLIGAVAAAGLIVTDPAGAQAALHAPVGAGYLASPKAVRSATVEVIVPRLTCPKSGSYSIAMGLFGFVKQGSTTSRWSVAVVASCNHGTTAYRAGDGTTFGHVSKSLTVRPGDRVELKKTDALDFEVDDVTSREGAGGGSSSTGPAPVLRTTMLFGARVTGKVASASHVALSSARVNGAAIGSVTHDSQRQTSGRKTIAYAGAVRTKNAFGIAIFRG